MTDKTRREFLKNLGKGAGTTLLTAGIVSSQKPQQRSVKTKVQTVKKVQKLGPEAKAYRKFLTTIQRQAPYPKKIPLSDLKWKSTTTNIIYNEAREAFKELTAPKGKPKTYAGRHSAGVANTIVKHSYNVPEGGEAFSKKLDKLIHKKTLEKEEDLKKISRTQLAVEKRNVRADKKPKKVTKRGLFEKIKSKLRKIKVRSGFGGPRSRKIGIGNQDPSRVSGYHY